MKQKLDKYFKQKLNTPQQPPEDAWEFIQSRLPKQNEKKRLLPFWMRLSGIAATLLLMLGVGYWLGTLNNSGLETPAVVVNPENTSGNSRSTIEPDSEVEQNFQGQVPNYLNPDSDNLTGHDQSSQTFSYGNSAERFHSNNNNQFTNSQYTNNYNNELNNDSFSQYNQNSISFLDGQALAYNNYEANSFDLTPILSLEMPTIQDAKLNQNNSSKFLLASNDKPNNEKEKKKKKQIDFDKFYVSAFASPLAFNTFVGNSMLADEMSQYKTENSITLAYGVKAAYALSPRLKVRTGISVVGLEQITNDVPLEVEIAGRDELATLDNNIKYNGSVRIDDNPYVTSLAEMELSGKIGYGDMQQQASYIEIPLEAELSLFQTNSIGISATGGGSTWLLSKNKIYVHTDDYTQELGEADNLNKVSFSANAGLKFDMNLTESIKLNVEPNFRYLINPVNNIEKYNPYTVGVNAGISVSLK